MEQTVRDLRFKAWQAAQTMGHACLGQAHAARRWAARTAKHWAPATILRRRHRAKQWALVKDAALMAAAYGARAAMRRYAPAAHKRHPASKS